MAGDGATERKHEGNQGRAWSTHVFIYIFKTRSTFIWRSRYRQTCENKTRVSTACNGMASRGKKGETSWRKKRCMSIRDQRNKGDNGDSRWCFDSVSKYAISWLAFSCFSRCLIISISFNDIPKSWEENFEFPRHFCSPPFHFRFVWTSDAVAALTVQHTDALSPPKCEVLSF